MARGRKPGLNTRKFSYRVRLNDEEKERLEQLSQKEGVRKADILRRILCQHEKSQNLEHG